MALGCGPVGCLVRIVTWIIGLVILLIVVGYLAISGLYIAGPRPVREGPDRFLGAGTVGYLQINDNPLHEASSGLIHKLADSLVQVSVERRIAKSSGLVRSLVRGAGGVVRHDIVPEVMPYGAFDLLSQRGKDAPIASAWAASSRMPARILSMAGRVWDWIPGNSGSRAAPLTIDVGSEDSTAILTYSTRRLGKMLTTFQENWILLTDSPAVLQSLLDHTRAGQVSDFVAKLRASVPDTSDIIFLLDNRYRAVQLVLQDLAPKRGAANPDIITYILGISPPVSDQIAGVAAHAWFITQDSLQARIIFTTQSELAALGLVALLRQLQRSIQQRLAGSHMRVGYTLALDRQKVIVTAAFAGVKQPILELAR